MKSKTIILIIPFVLCLSGCLSTNKHSIIGGNARTLSEQMYCPTTNEEARIFYNKGLEQTSLENFDEAIISYRKAVEIDSKYCDAMDNLGLLYRRQNNLDEAILWYRKSIEVFPKNSVAHNNLAVAYALKGLTDKAISEFKIVIGINKDNPEGYYGLGGIYQSINKYNMAIDNYKIAEKLYIAELSPLVSDARYQLSVSYFRLENCDMSTNYIKQIYSENIKNPHMYYMLGICSYASKNLEESKKYLIKAQDLGMKIPADLAQELNI